MSRLGMARFGEAAPIEAIRGGNWPKYTHDALIAATAQADGQVLVTEERRLQRRAETQLGVEVWNWQRWYAHLQSLT